MSSTRHRSRATRRTIFPRDSGGEGETALLDESKSEENTEVAFVRALEAVNALNLKAASRADDVELESILSSLWERTLCKTPQFHRRDGRSLIGETEWNRWREALTQFTLPSLLRRNSVRVQGALACVFLEALRISAPKVPFDEDTFRAILDLCIRVLDGLDNAANESHDQEGTLASSGGGVDAPAAVASLGDHTDSVREELRWSLRLLERISKTKVFALATAQQVGSLIGCLMSAAHHNVLNYRSKMQIVEVIVSTIVEQAHEADPWTGSANTITHVIEQILTPLTAQSPTQLGRSSFGRIAELETTGMPPWRFGARHVAEQVLQRAADSLQGPVAAYLREISTEKRHALIEILYRVAPSVLQYVLPNLSTESRVNDPQSRLRCVQLIANLFVHHFASNGGRGALFHDPNAIDRSLFLDLLERFQDVDPIVRAGTVRAVQELLVQLHRHISNATLTAKVSVADPKGASTLPRPLPAQMLQDLDRHLQDRLLDQDEKVRLAAVQTVLGSDARSAHTSLCVVSSLPLAGVAALSRVRDKRSTVRNCTIQSLARLYRVFMQWPCERQESTDVRANDQNTSPPAFVREWIIQLVRELLASYIQLTQVACTAAVPADEMLGSVVQIELLFYDARAVAAGCLSLWREALNKDGAQRTNRSFGVHGWTAFPANDALRLMMRARTHFQNDMRALLDMRDALRQRRRLSEGALSSEAAAVLERLSSSLGSPTIACGPECDSSATKLLLEVMQLRDERIFQNMRSLLNGASIDDSADESAIARDTIERLASRNRAAAQWFQAVVLSRLVPVFGRFTEIRMLVETLLREPEDQAAGSVECALALEAAACYGRVFRGPILMALLEAVPGPSALRLLAALGSSLLDAEPEWQRELAERLASYLIGQVDIQAGVRNLRGIKWAARILSTLHGGDAAATLWTHLIPCLQCRCLQAFDTQKPDSCACALAALAKIVRCAPRVVSISVQVQVLDLCLRLLTERPPNVGEPLAIACIIAASSIILSGFLARENLARSVQHAERVELMTHPALTADSMAADAPNTTTDMRNAQSEFAVTDPERVDRFLHAALMLVLLQGDWNAYASDSNPTNGTISAPLTAPDSVLDSEPCARLRYYAAKAILKLARVRTIDHALLPAERHLVCLLMQDPIFEIRHDFALKLFHGLARGHLPWHWMAALVLAAIDPERENITNARWYMTALIRQRRQLVRNLEQRVLASSVETTVSYLALMPECALPYVLHLLAHHPDYLLDAKNSFADNKKYLSFFLDALLEQGQHVGILLQLLRLVSASTIPPPVPQHIGGDDDDPRAGHRRSSVIVGEPVAQDVDAAARIMTERLHELAQLCTNVLKQKQAHKRWDLAEFPGPIQLPYPFFGSKKRNAETARTPDAAVASGESMLTTAAPAQ